MATSPASPSALAAPAAGKDRPMAWYQSGRAAVIGMAVLILVAVGVLAFRGGSRAAGVVTNLAAFSLPALSRKGWVRLAGYRGKPVVVNFFAAPATAS